MKAYRFIELAAGSCSRIYPMLAKAAIIPALLLLPLAVGPGIGIESGAMLYAGNGNGNGGGGGGKSDKGDLFGEMVYLWRNRDGVPLLINGCTRPLDEYGQLLALNGDYYIPDYDEDDPWVPELEADEIENLNECDDAVLTLTADPGYTLRAAAEEEEEDSVELCDPIPACAASLHEADLGRLSVLRSPDKVLDRSLAEAERLLKDATITLDHAGRLVANGTTFDSPLINLALMRQFHLFGALENFNPDSMDIPAYDYVLAAAFGLGTGDDKYGNGADPEVVSRVNAILKLAQQDPYIGAFEIAPSDRDLDTGYDLLDGWYIDYAGFSYDRLATFPGCISYDYFAGYDPEGNPVYATEHSTILETVFGALDPGVVDNIAGYGLAADDARRVLVFVHDIGDALLRGRVDAVFEDSYCSLQPQED